MAHRPESSDELEARARDVLREIVLQYVSDGEPISSRSLAKSGRFDLSPASLRNVMADLEDLGYVYQPHTSAGRIPTDRGYRFFINNLMRSRKISQHERDVIDGSVSQTSDMTEVMHLAGRLLSRLTDQVGVIFAPRVDHLVMRSIDFVLIHEHKILCVVVGENGVVVNRMIDTEISYTRDELDRIGRFLTGEFGGCTLEAVRAKLIANLKNPRAQEDAEFRTGVALGIEAVEGVVPPDHELVVEGATSILNKPEFSDADSMRKTFLAFEEREKLVDILNRCLGEDGLSILIGSENRFTQSYNFSIIATRYGAVSNPVGIVGVIGPTRMEYERMTTLVEYLGRALSRKIESSESGV